MQYTRTVTTSASVDDAMQMLLTALAGSRQTVTVPQPGTIIAKRTYRPGWVIVLAVVTSLLFLVGLLFLLITRVEVITIRVNQRGGRSEVIVSGDAELETIAQLNVGLRALPDLRDDAGLPVEIRDPVIQTTATLMEGGAMPLAGAPSAPAVQQPGVAMSAVSTPAVTAPIGPTCTGCGRTTGPNDRFCRGCGQATATICGSCGTQADPNDTFCTGCGARVKA